MARAFKSVCYCTNARRISNILNDYYDRTLAPIGINAAQFCLLRNLERIKQGNLTYWAEQTGIERSTMVRNVRHLEQIGLVEQTNGRGKVYMLSDKGSDCLKTGGVLWEKAQQKIENVLGQQDAMALLSIGQKIQIL
jgi:DNA-binding MarR family transcriptional regulator